MIYHQLTINFIINHSVTLDGNENEMDETSTCKIMRCHHSLIHPSRDSRMVAMSHILFATVKNISHICTGIDTVLSDRNQHSKISIKLRTTK